MSGINDEELREIYDFAVQLGKDAGAMLMDAIQRRIAGGSDDGDNNGGSQVAYVEKENAVDLVTKTDHGTHPHLPNFPWFHTSRGLS